jgi:hypothetical protein
MASVAAWLPFIRASAVGWIPLVPNSAQPIPPRPLAATRRGQSTSGGSDTGRIKINVSGQRFETCRQTLGRFPDTLLGSDERDYFYDDAADEYFFDRDPALFRRVLAYYRSGRIHYPRNECVAAFEDELAFFGIRATDAVADCCLVSRHFLSAELAPYFVRKQ